MKINARIATLLLLGAGMALPAPAQRNRLKKTPDISLNISARRDSVKTTYLNLGLISNIRRLQGVGINVVSSVVQGNMAGLQLSGLANVTVQNASGLQFAGFANVTGRNANGILLGGLMNVAGESTNGVQFAGLGNIAGNSSRGITVGGLLNMAGNQAQGVQIAGLANIAGNTQNGVAIGGLMNVSGEGMNGMQVSSILNISGGEAKGAQIAALGNVGVSVNGVQLALGNYAGKMNGAQIGLLNLCGNKMKGVQIGLVNISKDSTAHKVGLVNIDPRTRTQLLLFAGNASKLNAGVRFKNRRTYSLLGMGTHYLGLDDKFSGCVFYRTGLHYPLSRNVEISGDLGYFHIENFDNEDAETPERMYSLQARVNLECRLAPKLSLFASGGYGVTRHYDKDKCYEKKPIVELGVVLF